MAANDSAFVSIAFQTGHAAEFYLNHEESYSILSHAELLKGFGANVNLANDMLSDQGFYSYYTIFDNHFSFANIFTFEVVQMRNNRYLCRIFEFSLLS